MFQRNALSTFLIFLALWLTAYPSHSQPAPVREWTVMVYMNAKNNLEPHALDNFHSMASIGSTDAVAVVAELGRPASKRYTEADGNWTGVYRFHVTKGLEPRPEFAVADLAALGESTDMGAPASLRNFVSWAKRSYPAKRYMLVIWNHGQGWRFLLSRNADVRQAASVGQTIPAREASMPLPTIGGFRAVSSDDDTGSILYNKEVQDVVQSEFRDKKLDLLGFDACLMAMMETAYGFAPSTGVMVASEELEPGAGWRYSYWLEKLMATPGINAEALAAEVVEAYRKQYGNEYETTLSAIRLESVRLVAKELSGLADAIRQGGPTEITALKQARASLKSYGSSVLPPLRTSVDLIALLKRYEKKTTNEALRQQSERLRKRLAETVIRNYASARSAAPPDGAPYGSEGLSIYLPESAGAFYADYYHTGYLKKNADRPVDFVKNETWPELVYRVLAIEQN